MYILYILYPINIARAVNKMSVNKIKDFMFQNYYKRVGFLRKTVITQGNT